jgi:glutamate racemase
MLPKQPIGIFDSGIGGLTVLRKLQNALPHEHFVYFADTANLPYGDKTPEQIISFARQTLSWMQNVMGAKLVVAACHTSSATAIDIVSPEFNIPIVGTIYPMVETLLANYQHKTIGIIATPTSVQSRMHENILKQAGFLGKIVSISCPKFVPIIESGRISGPELLRCAHEYMEVLQDEKLDALIYGCTHYPWISDIIQQVVPAEVDLLDPAEHIAAKVSQELYKHKMLNTSWNKEKVQFFSSSDPERFASQVNLLLSIPNPSVRLAEFTNLFQQIAV